MQHGGTAWLCCRPRPSLPESPRNTEVLPSPQCSLETTFPLDPYDTCGGVIGLDTEPGLASSVWPGSACLSGSRAPSSTLQLSGKEHLDQLGSTPLSPIMPSNHASAFPLLPTGLSARRSISAHVHKSQEPDRCRVTGFTSDPQLNLCKSAYAARTALRKPVLVSGDHTCSHEQTRDLQHSRDSLTHCSPDT